LSVFQISKSYTTEALIQNATFTVNAGERIGLIGPNGSGKTTLLRILAGEEKPDTGGFHLDPPNLPVGYLPQGLSPDPSETIGSFLNRMEGDVEGLSRRLEELALALGETPELADLQREYDKALSRLSSAAEGAGRGPGILAGLGLGHLPLEMPAANLSGGQKTRLALAGVLLSNPQLLLLDEPTNHLDLDMLDWLESWLNAYPYAALIVSHDRTFLDRTATGILELDVQTHGLRFYPGNYTAYLEQKQAETDRRWQQYTDQLEEIARLKAAAAHLRGIAKFRKGGKADSGDKFARGFFANRGKETIGRAKNIEHRLETLLTDEKVDKPRSSWQMKIDFGEVATSGRDVLVFDRLSAGYGEQVLLEDLNLTLRYGQRVALIGPNGTGKTTLIRTIAGKIAPLSGEVRIGSNVRLGTMAQEQEDLDPASNALASIQRLAALNETEARSFLSKFLFKGDDVFTPVSSLSYGERARLSLACLVASGCNLLLLDEPINHLDIPARSRFEQAIAGFEGTVLAVVHDRYFIEGFASEIWEVSGRTIRTRDRL